ncbi:unnamed protein product [Ilex paraguariensis]|uniref:Uncharacterized protein n=1 Tax=Ilex paraguariensis TaxID=185542 RepID=A0ABC8QPA3_9AQUA
MFQILSTILPETRRVKVCSRDISICFIRVTGGAAVFIGSVLAGNFQWTAGVGGGGVGCAVEPHGCTFDFKAMGREAIANAKPVIKAAKLEKI